MSGACIISPGGRAGVGGIQSYARSIADRLAADFPDRRVTLLDPRGPSIWLSPLYLLAALAQLVWLAARGAADVAHLQVSERMSFARKGLLAMAARGLGMRVVLHHHGAELIPFYRAAPRWAQRLIRALVRQVDENVVLGAVWARFLIDELGVRPGNVSVLYNGIEDRAPPQRAETGARPLRILFLAVMTRRKGARVLLEALARLKEEGVAFEAVLAGGGPDLDPCRAEARRLGLAADCAFPGWVGPAQRDRLMREADVFVSPSSHEGLPISILEALRAGAPVLTTPVGAIAEALPQGPGVQHFPVGGAARLAGQLIWLARSPHRRAAQGEAARATFETRFLLSNHMAGLRRIYGWEAGDGQAVAG